MPYDDEGTRALVARAAQLRARLAAEGMPADVHRARMLQDFGPEGLLRVLVAAAPDEEARRAALKGLEGIWRLRARWHRDAARARPSAAQAATPKP